MGLRFDIANRESKAGYSMGEQDRNQVCKTFPGGFGKNMMPHEGRTEGRWQSRTAGWGTGREQWICRGNRREVEEKQKPGVCGSKAWHS